MMAVVGAFSYEFQVVLPVFARSTFHANADAYGFLTATLGVGAVVGGLIVAGRRSPGCAPAPTACCSSPPMNPCAAGSWRCGPSRSSAQTP